MPCSWLSWLWWSKLLNRYRWWPPDHPVWRLLSTFLPPQLKELNTYINDGAPDVFVFTISTLGVGWKSVSLFFLSLSFSCYDPLVWPMDRHWRGSMELGLPKWRLPLRWWKTPSRRYSSSSPIGERHRIVTDIYYSKKGVLSSNFFHDITSKKLIIHCNMAELTLLSRWWRTLLPSTMETSWCRRWFWNGSIRELEWNHISTGLAYTNTPPPSILTVSSQWSPVNCLRRMTCCNPSWKPTR